MTQRQARPFEGTDRFTVLQLLGRGGMGAVYAARDRQRGHVVALKTLGRFDARALARFKNEFRTLHDVDHPNLVSLYELFEHEGEWFFTMELLEGRTSSPTCAPPRASTRPGCARRWPSSPRGSMPCTGPASSTGT
ncbi:MAG TPA: protein kinase [Polyangiaceae bacterium LLY-WYZ-15_(1-7)]|nr:hypothetical protein [Myxococcales bacterium]MAT23893.1 hypothetical protein [Sandaracinus sp.]HJL00535.1 protein kinase [Polyangiaceae bacterium LLY-WYZ-15_(1-7)]MBJ71182.1 hypothetical protein [Sandaracinus sp.]HJL12389.1 protein kinase [Polyangiaceae bacterium LLY-WYZ-15_(1-7)]